MIQRFLLIFLGFTCLLSRAQELNESLYAYAQKAPKTNDIELLTEYLKEGAQGEKDLATVLAYWMMDNIAYDVRSYVSGSYPSTDWETTLQSKKAVCSGYANLYQELCKRVGLHSEVVSGYAKGFSYKKDTQFNRTNHAWNFILLEGKPYLLDITWASGYVEYQGNRLTFVKFQKPEKLFTAPEVFIEKHLPGQERWQLLNHPVSFENYTKYSLASEMINPATTYFNYEDSIETYLALPEVERQIADAEAITNVNPNDENLPHYFERVAFTFAQEFRSQHHLERSKKFYQLAKSMYKLATDQKRCDQGIKYADFYLNRL